MFMNKVLFRKRTRRSLAYPWFLSCLPRQVVQIKSNCIKSVIISPDRNKKTAFKLLTSHTNTFYASLLPADDTTSDLSMFVIFFECIALIINTYND